MKQVSLAVAIIGLLLRVYVIYHGSLTLPAHQALSPQATEQLRHHMQASAAEVGEKVPGHAPAPTPTASAAAVADAERQEIEGALKTMHVTTIMPGQPGLIIINNDKQEYSEGESLPLPKGRKARIAAVQDDGVQLTCDNMAFHLDPPAAPDLAALRTKKK